MKTDKNLFKEKYLIFANQGLQIGNAPVQSTEKSDTPKEKPGKLLDDSRKHVKSKLEIALKAANEAISKNIITQQEFNVIKNRLDKMKQSLSSMAIEAVKTFKENLNNLLKNLEVRGLKINQKAYQGKEIVTAKFTPSAEQAPAITQQNSPIDNLPPQRVNEFNKSISAGNQLLNNVDLSKATTSNPRENVPSSTITPTTISKNNSDIPSEVTTNNPSV